MSNARQALRSIAMVVASGAVSVSPGQFVQGVCDPSFYTWIPPTTDTTAGVASAPASDTLFNPEGYSYSYLAQGDTLFAIRNVPDADGPAGSIKWTWQGTPATPLPSSPVPVLVSQGRESIFLAAEDGFLYKINSEDGTTRASIDLRRASCPSDMLLATPAVQLYKFSNSAFQSALNDMRHRNDDLIFVITADGCSDTTHNRVFALFASDLRVAWSFNADQSVNVDRSIGGCVIEYAMNMLFCGTDLGASPPRTLFALDTLTGTLIWSQNAGAIVNRPMVSHGLSGERLYVASRDGIVQAFDPSSGLVLWQLALEVASPGAAVTRNIWPEGRGGGYDNRILVVDSLGILRLIGDQGTSGSVVWTLASPPGGMYVSMPVATPGNGKIYIGRNDGYMQQVDSSGGVPQVQGVMAVNPGGTVFDPLLDVDPSTGALDRLVVAAGESGGGGGGQGDANPHPDLYESGLLRIFELL